MSCLDTLEPLPVHTLIEEDLHRQAQAVPGVDAIRLHGTVTSFTVAANGNVTLEGRLREKDFSRGGGVVFVEEGVPFTIVVSPDSEQFTLQWCELPTFYLEVTDGDLESVLLLMDEEADQWFDEGGYLRLVEEGHPAWSLLG